ncbi:methyltransferase domain-containing protein, partial [Nostoc sp. NIES-2111]
ADDPWWYRRLGIHPGGAPPGVVEPSGRRGARRLPGSLSGVNVLEIGPADGYFTKQLALRGAKVTACDVLPKDRIGFAIMEALHGTPLDYRQINIYRLPEAGLPQYDIVLCLGVLYHLPDMVRALHNLRERCSGQLILETLVAMDLGTEPLARYHPASSLNNDDTNFWSPSMACVEAMLTDAGFEVEDRQIFHRTEKDGRACFWAKPTSAARETIKTSKAYAGL